jgi:hypothetical protein
VKLEKPIKGAANNLGLGFAGALIAALAGADLIAVLSIGVVVCASTVWILERRPRKGKGVPAVNKEPNGAPRRRKSVGIRQTGGTSNYETTVMRGLDVGIDQSGGNLQSKGLLIDGVDADVEDTGEQ